MTFLELCQRTAREAGISGNGPSSVTTTILQEKKIVEWVRSAWLEIQTLRRGWGFMWDEFSLSAVVGQMAYPLDSTTGLTTFSHIETVTAYGDDADKEWWLTCVRYPDFRANYLIGEHPAAKPSVWSVSRDRSLLLGPKPDSTYTVRGTGYLLPQRLENNTDTLTIPDRHSDVVVFRALMLFAGHEEASTIYQESQINFNRAMIGLENEYLPEVTTLGSLA
jgi:hypothetical protein